MTFSDLEWLSKIFNDTKRRVVSGLIFNCWYTPWVDCVGWATWTTYCLGLWFLDTLWLRDENIVVETYSSPVVKRLLLLNLDKIVSGLSTGVIIDNFA